MKSTIVILKEVNKVQKLFSSMNKWIDVHRNKRDNKTHHPFLVVVQKEISDHMRSWRFIILLSIILLTCLGSLYTSMVTIRDTITPEEAEGGFFFLKLFTVSDGTVPSFITFVSFLG